MYASLKKYFKGKCRNLVGYNDLMQEISVLNTKNAPATQDEGKILINDYPYFPRERSSFPSSRIKKIIEESVKNSNSQINEILNNIKEYRDVFNKIPLTEEAEGEPFWNNSWIPPIDGMMIYSILSKRNPRLYVECGSGNTTKFASKAIKNNKLRTKIISIDPNPRAEIDRLCSKIYRIPLERMDIDFFKTLTDEDIFLVDNSHRAFANSDVTVFFTEILPILPKLLLYALHDIALPNEIFMERFYNEQYMLAAYLLGGGDGDSIYFPTGYISNYTSMLEELQTIMNLKGINLNSFGGFFWMVKN